MKPSTTLTYQPGVHSPPPHAHIIGTRRTITEDNMLCNMLCIRPSIHLPIATAATQHQFLWLVNKLRVIPTATLLATRRQAWCQSPYSHCCWLECSEACSFTKETGIGHLLWEDGSKTYFLLLLQRLWRSFLQFCWTVSFQTWMANNCKLLLIIVSEAQSVWLTIWRIS